MGFKKSMKDIFSGEEEDDDSNNESHTHTQSDTYIIRAMCKNCRHKQKITIPKGISVEKHFSSGVKCEKCHLFDLKKMRNQKISKDDDVFSHDTFDDFYDDHDFADNESETIPLTPELWKELCSNNNFCRITNDEVKIIKKLMQKGKENLSTKERKILSNLACTNKKNKEQN